MVEARTQKKRVGILISGRGSNMQALVQATRDPDYPAEIVGVISNRTDAAGLAFATAHEIPTKVITMKESGGADAADMAMTAQLRVWDVDYVCLAGFMRILTPTFTHDWSERLLNIHPSLLPEFKGLDTHQRAIDAGVTEHGCSVHFVVPDLDAGQVIAQARVSVLPDDTAATLAARVLVEEHKLYPRALRMVIEGPRSS